MNNKEMYDNLIARRKKTYGFYLTWSGLVHPDSKIENTAYKVIPEAMLSLRRALFDALIVNCSSLMEKTKDTSSIPNLVKQTGKGQKIPKVLDELSNKIFNLRSNCVAHHNSIKNHHEHFDYADLKPQDFEDFLTEIGCFLNDLNPYEKQVQTDSSDEIQTQIVRLFDHLSTLK